MPQLSLVYFFRGQTAKLLKSAVIRVFLPTYLAFSSTYTEGKKPILHQWTSPPPSHCLNGILQLVTDANPIIFELNKVTNFQTFTADWMEGATVTTVRHVKTMDFPVLFRMEFEDVPDFETHSL
jgi:hypothetical protein